MDVLGLRRVMSNPSDQEHRGRSRPTGALRLAFRLPIYLYRLGLGQLLGHRFMLLTHRGRRSGRVYQTALGVVRYDPSLRETVVASGWGERSDWYRNLKAHPALEIRTGRERYAPEQRFLTPEEVYQEIVDYERRHPWAVRIVPSLLGFRLDGSDAARRAFANSVRMVAFRPRQGPSSRGRSTAASSGRPAAGKREEHGVSRIFGLSEKDAGLLVRFAYRFSRRRFGKVPEPVGVTVHHRQVALVVGCEFCVDIGSILGKELGITDDQLRALPRYRESAAFSPLEKLVLEYAVGMSGTPATIPDHLFEELRGYFDEAQLVELTAAIAWENHRARFNHALGMGYGGFSEGSYCLLAGDSEEGSIPRMEVHE